MQRSLLYLAAAVLTFAVGCILSISWAMAVFYVTGVKAKERSPTYFKCGFTESGNPGYHTQYIPELMEFAAPLPPIQTHLFPHHKASLRKHNHN
jgi:hypothetical protein